MAQSGSALAWGARGRKFESCYTDQDQVQYILAHSPGGGIGRRSGLKIRRETVWVRVPPWAPTDESEQ